MGGLDAVRRSASLKFPASACSSACVRLHASFFLASSIPRQAGQNPSPQSAHIQHVCMREMLTWVWCLDVGRRALELAGTCFPGEGLLIAFTSGHGNLGEAMLTV